MAWNYALPTDAYDMSSFTSLSAGGISSFNCAIATNKIIPSVAGGYFGKNFSAQNTGYFSMNVIIEVADGLRITGFGDSAGAECYIQINLVNGKYVLECGILPTSGGVYPLVTSPLAPRVSSTVTTWAANQQVELVFTRTGSRLHVYQYNGGLTKILIDMCIITDGTFGGTWDYVPTATAWWRVFFLGSSGSVLSLYYRQLSTLALWSDFSVFSDSFNTNGTWAPTSTAYASVYNGGPGWTVVSGQLNVNTGGPTSLPSNFFGFITTEFPPNLSYGAGYYIRFRYLSGPLRFGLVDGQIVTIKGDTSPTNGYQYCIGTLGKSESVAAGSNNLVSVGDYFHIAFFPNLGPNHRTQAASGQIKVWKTTSATRPNLTTAADFAATSSTASAWGNLAMSTNNTSSPVVIDDFYVSFVAPSSYGVSGTAFYNVTPVLLADGAGTYAKFSSSGRLYVASSTETNQLQFFDFYDKVYS